MLNSASIPPFFAPAAAVHLTLLAPELIWPEPHDQLTLGKLPMPGFERFNAFAPLQRHPRCAYEHTLADCFGLPAPAFGPLRLLGESTGEAAQEGLWLCADPVHLRFHHERIVLADAGAFDLSEDEAGQLVESLNATFADIGQFHAATPRRWYLKLNIAVDHLAEPLSAIAGKRLTGDPLGAKSPLAGTLNEIQMFLHSHPVNRRREQSGQPVVNSVWLWGTGSLPTVTAAYTQVASNDPLAIGLARRAGIAQQPRPASLAALLANTRRDDHALVVLDQLLGPVLYETPDDWRTAWQALDTEWFAPLNKALGREVKSVRLIAPTIYGNLEWQSEGRGRWQFWKKGQSIATLAKALGNTPL